MSGLRIVSGEGPQQVSEQQVNVRPPPTGVRPVATKVEEAVDEAASSYQLANMAVLANPERKLVGGDFFDDSTAPPENSPEPAEADPAIAEVLDTRTMEQQQVPVRRQSPPPLSPDFREPVEEEEPQRPDPRDEEVERVQLLAKVFRMQKQGVEFSKPVGSDTTTEELRAEIHRVTEDREKDAGLKFSRRLLLAMVTGLEYANERFDPLGVRLQGWSEQFMTNVEEYDPVLSKLHEKYNTKLNAPPEVEMLTMLLGSMFMYHLTATLFKPSQGSNVSQMARDNPEMMRNFARSMQQGRMPMQAMESMLDEGANPIQNMFGGSSAPASNPFGMGMPEFQKAGEEDVSSADGEDDEDDDAESFTVRTITVDDA